MKTREEPDAAGSGIPPRPPLLRELLLVAGLFLVYKAGRQLATGHTAQAYRNGHDVWDLERALGLPGEGVIQSVLLHGDGGLAQVANTYYAAVHFPATAAFLVWLYLRRPAHYVWARRVLAGVTGAALVLHLAFPLAPPRMLAATGLVDTGRVYGPSVYGPPHTDQLSNQFAAMPSLHFGWALMVALGLIAATRSRLRRLWLLHPLLTLLVIVGTANHFWLDAVVAGILLGLALAVSRGPGRARAMDEGAVTAVGAGPRAEAGAGAMRGTQDEVRGRAAVDDRDTDGRDVEVGAGDVVPAARDTAGRGAVSGQELVEARR